MLACFQTRPRNYFAGPKWQNFFFSYLCERMMPEVQFRDLLPLLPRHLPPTPPQTGEEQTPPAPLPLLFPLAFLPHPCPRRKGISKGISKIGDFKGDFENWGFQRGFRKLGISKGISKIGDFENWGFQRGFRKLHSKKGDFKHSKVSIGFFP